MSMVRIHPWLSRGATKFSRGRRSTDQDTRLRTGRLGGSNPPARTNFGSSSNGQGAALRRLKFRFDPGRADQRIAERRPTGEVPGCLPGLGEFDSRTLRQIAAMWTSWLSHPSFKRVIAGSNPAIATTGLQLMRMSRRFLIVRQRVRFSPGQPSFVG